MAEGTGTIVKVSTGARTTISVSSTGSVSDLHPGDRVAVVGKKNEKKNGTVSTTSVSDSGSTGASPSRSP